MNKYSTVALQQQCWVTVVLSEFCCRIRPHSNERRFTMMQFDSIIKPRLSSWSRWVNNVEDTTVYYCRYRSFKVKKNTPTFICTLESASQSRGLCYINQSYLNCRISRKRKCSSLFLTTNLGHKHNITSSVMVTFSWSQLRSAITSYEVKYFCSTSERIISNIVVQYL